MEHPREQQIGDVGAGDQQDDDRHAGDPEEGARLESRIRTGRGARRSCYRLGPSDRIGSHLGIEDPLRGTALPVRHRQIGRSRLL